MRKHDKTICCFLILCLLAGTGVNASPTSELYCSPRVAAYYPYYYVDILPVSQIRFDQLTDIIFFSAYPNEDGTLNADRLNQEDPNATVDLVQAANDNNVKVWLCVGGSSTGSEYFHTVVTSPFKRALLIEQLMQFSLVNGFEGIDLDWEPITAPFGYATFIRDLKAEMVPHGLELSVDVYAGINGLNADAFDSVDWLHVMAYDMYKESPHSTYEDALAGLEFWENAGFPRHKMTLGLPFFGRNIPYNNIYHTYKQIVDLYHPTPDIDQVGTINFNGINTIKDKTRYVLENGYGGVMFWELTNDTTDETSLLTAINEQVQASSPPDFNCDRVVNLSDLAYIASDWLTDGCMLDNTWCQRSDLDLSETVDIKDLAIFSGCGLGPMGSSPRI
ncbi:MAG: glycosyl hydrolase family 18 protein [Planctomycetota bacterium]|jgi:hypothetical protein